MMPDVWNKQGDAVIRMPSNLRFLKIVEGVDVLPVSVEKIHEARLRKTATLLMLLLDHSYSTSS